MKIYAPCLSFINPRNQGYRCLYASYSDAYWREEEELFYGWQRCSEAMNFFGLFYTCVSVLFWYCRSAVKFKAFLLPVLEWRCGAVWNIRLQVSFFRDLWFKSCRNTRLSYKRSGWYEDLCSPIWRCIFYGRNESKFRIYFLSSQLFFSVF
jgi:hypothetical protein